MRISGGILAGRTVKVPPGIIRPSMDRMRESIFALLGGLSGRSFLDLFTGSGIIALEAVSRGAGPVDAVEADPGKRKILLDNVSISPARISCHFMAAELYVKRAKNAFDLIFCDPPFNYRYKRDLLLSIAASPLMNISSLLMIHRPKPEQLGFPGPGGAPAAKNNQNSPLFIEKTRFYGTSAVDFLQKIPLLPDGIS